MTAGALLRDLERHGLRLTPNGENLRVRGPKSAMTSQVLDRIRAHKLELLGLLRAGGDGTPEGNRPSPHRSATRALPCSESRARGRRDRRDQRDQRSPAQLVRLREVMR